MHSLEQTFINSEGTEYTIDESRLFTKEWRDFYNAALTEGAKIMAAKKNADDHDQQ